MYKCIFISFVLKNCIGIVGGSNNVDGPGRLNNNFIMELDPFPAKILRANILIVGRPLHKTRQSFSLLHHL